MMLDLEIATDDGAALHEHRIPERFAEGASGVRTCGT